MTAFRFPLEKALGWRQTQLNLAQIRLEQQLAALHEIDRALEDLVLRGRQADADVRRFAVLSGEDLNALAGFGLRLKVRGAQLARQRADCQKELAARQAAVLEARRQCRLLERLKERRWAEWQTARDRELAEVAADSYMAQWTRRQTASL